MCPVYFDIEADFIGITANVSQAKRAIEIAQEFRARGKPVIIGGGRRGVVSTACYIARIRDLFGEAQVVVVFRRQADYAQSLYQEHVKVTRYRGNFREFLNDFWYHFVFAEQARAWNAAFPGLQAMLFDRLTATGDPTAEFCRLLGLPVEGLGPVPRANEGLPVDLVQVLPQPVNKALTQTLMEAADLVVVTGSQNNVRRAYSSGTPAIGVGAGNVSVIVDSSADLKDAAEKITMSKIFDNSTSCSSENAVIILDDVYDDALAALKEAGGYLTSADEKQKIQDTLWVDGHLNRKVIAKDADVFAAEAGLEGEAKRARFFMVEDSGPGPGHPFADEKLSLVLTVYRAKDFDDAMAQVRAIMDVCGLGHSVGIHTQDLDHARKLAEDLDVVRVLVNQAHTFGNGGSFTNGLEFTLSMGCGTWAGNSISENLNYRHFINVTHLVTEIPEDKPSEDALFGDYWAKHGK